MSRTVLIADDEPQNRRLFHDILEKFGYRVLEAENGELAVQAARAEKPDLILLDIHMPVMDGWEAVRAIRKDAATRKIPVLALTADALSGENSRLGAAGFNGYLTKPISIKSFLARVAEFVPPPNKGE